MPKKRKYNRSTGRDYKYDTAYNARPEQVKNRVARNKARRQKRAELTEKYGKAKADKMLSGRDIDHIRPLSKGGSNSKSNRRLLSKSKNRGRK